MTACGGSVGLPVRRGRQGRGDPRSRGHLDPGPHGHLDRSRAWPGRLAGISSRAGIGAPLRNAIRSRAGAAGTSAAGRWPGSTARSGPAAGLPGSSWRRPFAGTRSRTRTWPGRTRRRTTREAGTPAIACLPGNTWTGPGTCAAPGSGINVPAGPASGTSRNRGGAWSGPASGTSRNEGGAWSGPASGTSRNRGGAWSDPRAGTWIRNRAGAWSDPRAGTWIRNRAGACSDPPAGTWIRSRTGACSRSRAGAWACTRPPGATARSAPPGSAARAVPAGVPRRPAAPSCTTTVGEDDVAMATERPITAPAIAAATAQPAPRLVMTSLTPGLAECSCSSTCVHLNRRCVAGCPLLRNGTEAGGTMRAS